MTNTNIVNENGNVANNATSANNSNEVLMKNLPSIITLSMLKQKGIKIARLAGNRSLDDKIVRAKKKSLKLRGQLVPAIIVDAEQAIDEGLDVVDFETNEIVTLENANQYVVLVDANHRYKAHIELLKEDSEYDKEFSLMYPLQDIDVSKMLIEINISTNPWKTADYGHGAAMVIGEDLPLLNAINELTRRGYSVESACKWLTFDNKITKSVLANAMQGTVKDALLDVSGMERGHKLIAAAKKSFGENFLKKRNLPDWIITKFHKFAEKIPNISEKMCSFLAGIGRELAEEIENYKGERGVETKESLVNRKLDSLWADYIK